MRQAKARDPLSVGFVTLTLLTAAATARAADSLFVSKFLTPTGAIVRIDLPAGAETEVATGLDYPEDGACSLDGHIYFPEIDGTIHSWRQNGTAARTIKPAGVVHPEGLSFSPVGDLYYNSRPESPDDADGVWRIDGGNWFSTPVQVVPMFSSFGEGTDIVMGGRHQGALLFVDNAGRQVFLSEPPGSPRVGFIPSAALKFPFEVAGILTDGCGDSYVVVITDANTTRSAVLRYDPDGKFIETYASGVGKWTFSDFDSQGYLYVSDGLNHTVWRVAPDKSRSALASVEQAAGVAVCRDQRVLPCWNLVCSTGGPYSVECQGPSTCVQLDAGKSTSASGGTLHYLWTSDCPGATFNDATGPKPTVCMGPTACRTRCTVTVTVDDGLQSRSCTDPVEVLDRKPPVLTVPVPATVDCTSPGGTPVGDPAVQAWLGLARAVDACNNGIVTSTPPAFFPSACAPGVTTPVGFGAHDDCGNAAANQTSTLTVADLTPPVVTGCALPFVSPPLPPRPAMSACSAPTDALVRVECGTASDLCDPSVTPRASFVVTNHDVSGGVCVRKDTQVQVACGDQVELRRLAPPCPSRPPRSPAVPVSVRSDGLKALSGESISLEVRSADNCGNLSAPCVVDATSPAGPLPCPPKAPRCPSSACGISLEPAPGTQTRSHWRREPSASPGR